MRDRWPSGPADFEDCSYLAQIAAFHSRTHKHADDLSFVWYEGGRELLVDAGRYGYLGRLDAASELGRQGFMYADPNRVYVESTRAHNTVEIDGLSHPRRQVPFYGSALEGWGDRDGVMWSECAATFHKTVEHRRVLVLRPGEWLLVIDALACRRRRRHSFSQRFHFAPELSATDDGQQVEVTIPEVSERLWMTALLPGGRLDGVVCGQTEPELLGLVSREAYQMLPAPTAAYQVTDAPRHVFATLLSLDAEAPLPAPVQRVDESGRRGELRWQSGGAAHTIGLEPDAAGRLMVRAERTAR